MYILSFLQQGNEYHEKPWFVSKCQRGNGIGGQGSTDRWISNSYTVKQCVDAVRSQYPTANGFTTAYKCPNGCKCWAEFEMTGWSHNIASIETRKACKFNDKGNHISVTM